MEIVQKSLLQFYDHISDIFPLSKQQSLLLVFRDRKKLIVFHPETNQIERIIPLAYKESTSFICLISHDEQILVIISQERGSVSLFNIEKGLFTAVWPYKSERTCIATAILHDNDHLLLAYSINDEFTLYDLMTRKTILSQKRLSKSLNLNCAKSGRYPLMTFKPDSWSFFLCGVDEYLYECNLASSRSIKKVKLIRSALSVAVTPDKKYLAIGTIDIRLLDIETLETYRSFQIDLDNRGWITFSKDSRYLASVGMFNDSINVVDLVQMKKIAVKNNAFEKKATALILIEERIFVADTSKNLRILNIEARQSHNHSYCKIF